MAIPVSRQPEKHGDHLDPVYAGHIIKPAGLMSLCFIIRNDEYAYAQLQYTEPDTIQFATQPC